jgi:hypothetical protein
VTDAHLTERRVVSACFTCGTRQLVDAEPVDLLAAQVDGRRRRVDARLAEEDRKLAAQARLIANVRSRPGREQATDAALRALLTSDR